MQKLNAIIIEASVCHIEFIEKILHKKHPSITVSGVAKTIDEANRIIKNNKFDIVFLDMNLDGDSDFDLLKSLSPHIAEKELIITSSYKKHALEAFKYLATDFIIKPLFPDDIVKAVEKARRNIELKRLTTRRHEEFHDHKPLRALAIPSLTEVKIIPVDDIIYLQSEGRYTIFYTSNNMTIVSSKNIGEYEKALINNNFFRIHHSYLANMNLALNILKKDGMYLEMAKKKYLPISKRKTDPLYLFLGIR